MKYILIIGDGMADNPVPTLDNKTPLQHAAIPVMDGLAAKGEVGNVVNCPGGDQADKVTPGAARRQRHRHSVHFRGRPQCLLHRPLPLGGCRHRHPAPARRHLLSVQHGHL